jgi:ABC-type nitrate/sulfonate/bicarbonate transport system substrate-binding protein
LWRGTNGGSLTIRIKASIGAKASTGAFFASGVGMGDSSVSLTRRRFLQAGAALGGAMLMPGLMQSAWAAGSDKPELTTVRVGFIPLTDCAPLVIALKGFDKKYGITLVPTKEASWAAVRDKLVSGELDAARALWLAVRAGTRDRRENPVDGQPDDP